jgi:hypothetical protein
MSARAQEVALDRIASAATSRHSSFRPVRRSAVAALLLCSLGFTTAHAAPRAVIVEPTHLQLGEVEPGQLQKLEWTLRNDGDAPLLIESLTPTCYCTTGKADAKQVEPKGTTKIHVTIDPSDFVGRINKGIEIATNDPAKPKQLIDVDLIVRPASPSCRRSSISATCRPPAAPRRPSI